jgi:hypothetical protein
MQVKSGRMKTVIWILGCIAIGVIVVSVGLNAIIGRGVYNESQKAVAQFGGGRVEALIALADCQICSVYDRTQAVWALGQLRDKRALPILYKYYTGGPCDHQRQICQKELRKAIRWTEGNSFMLPQLWRPLLPDNKDRPSKILD